MVTPLIYFLPVLSACSAYIVNYTQPGGTPDQYITFQSKGCKSWILRNDGMYGVGNCNLHTKSMINVDNLNSDRVYIKVTTSFYTTPNMRNLYKILTMMIIGDNVEFEEFNAPTIRRTTTDNIFEFDLVPLTIADAKMYINIIPPNPNPGHIGKVSIYSYRCQTTSYNFTSFSDVSAGKKQ